MRLRQLTLTLVLLGGCLDAGTTICGDLICPPGLVCASEQELCVLAEQNEACAGRPDGDACVFGTSNGQCQSETCLDYRCANGILEFGEVCDDGNGLSGDGCSGDCMSDESCGNGVIDSAAGEMCDDGNQVSEDGCQENCALPRCGDGFLDEDEVCDDGNFEDGDECNARCSSDETCGNGVIDVVAGEACDDGNLIVGDSCGATCQIEVCGNSIVDPGELCDDGNTVGGDGCGAACTSLETCGNGVLDPDESEQCDDGNFASQDGCSSLCSVEVPFWSGPRRSQSRRYASMVFDARRGELFVAGGEGGAGEAIGSHEVRRRAQWIPDTFAGQPAGRIGHVSVYDAARRRVLVFGGRSPTQYIAGQARLGTLLGDAFVLDASGWAAIETIPARAYAAAAYDTQAQRVVLFGGEDGDVLGETWTYDGSWTQLTPAVSPPPRSRHGMVYDTERQVTVLYGGEDADGDPLSDTWEFDGAEWREVAVEGPPVRGSLVYDPRRDETLLFAGSSNTASNELWAYDGGAWSQLTPEGPSARLGSAVAYDPLLGGLVVHQGAASAPGDSLDETWLFTGTWSLLDNQRAPTQRQDSAAFFDARDDRVHVLGGELGGELDGVLSEAWTYQATGWEVGELLPFDTLVTSAVHDRARRQNLLVTVSDDSSELETWVHRAQRWERLPIVGPPVRTNAALTYDPENERVLLFGGRSGSRFLNDLWEYDGEWREIATTNAPAGRREPLIAFDAARGVLVCSPGGRGEAGLSIWELEGTNWRRGVPLLAAATQLLYYPPSGSIWAVSGLVPNVRAWAFRNDEWTLVDPPSTPASRVGNFAVYDIAHRSVVVGLGEPNSDTLSLRFGSRARDERCLEDVDRDMDGAAGCEDPDCNDQRCAQSGERCIAGTCQCEFSMEIACGDGFDDDCDGATDCDDADCAADVRCRRELDCQDGLDDDADGLTDCADPGCAASAPCEEIEVSCTDGIDNDGNGQTDCADVGCFLRSCEDVTP